MICRGGVEKFPEARGHWQIAKHEAEGMREGGFRTLPPGEAPPAVIEAALAAAREELWLRLQAWFIKRIDA